ncbi:FeMo cofactor biosynthesis protein NifB [Methanobrevibacter cuticularis]|uniref:FeMo cofactor biosynthesis protein NifB n=1 Tax=Methanobrevibacter cuticularis TaxID=47311 RepID=A0A166E6J1_9EURY|nr:radical SAM protein [Methanobrevibacter cuticularis]KZX16332.1 FeMo cofactor biosynthesis protein NifB [Methanobrevibacter cuticularis]
MKEQKGEGSKFAHITRAHPCFNEKMHDKVGRAHVPIAPKCNIYCNFCTRDINKDEARPGVAACVMDPDAAIEHVKDVTKEGPISVVGVAGPGDALANEETYEFFKKLGDTNPDLIKCMSTNGLLLPEKAEEIANLGVNTVTVTVNAIDPEIAKDIYSFIKYKGKVYKGKEAVEILIKNQLEGIEKLSNLGVIIKVNSVLIPGLNDEHIVEIAKEVKKRGASLMNVLPLIPLNKMKEYSKPTCAEIEKVRDEVEEIIPVFRACTQCRADAFGIPGKKNEDKHLGMTPASHY